MPTPAPVAPKKFLTNQGENTLSKRLEKILPLTEDFDCLVGYFFISGFFRLYPALESVKKIRILIGLKNEQVVHGLIQIANDGFGESDDAEAYVAAVKQNAEELRKRMLKYIMVRRTRREIEGFYGDDLKRQKIWFPKVNDPVPLLYQLNPAESAVFTSTLTKGLVRDSRLRKRAEVLGPTLTLDRRRRAIATRCVGLA